MLHGSVGALKSPVPMVWSLLGLTNNASTPAMDSGRPHARGSALGGENPAEDGDTIFKIYFEIMEFFWTL